ncbi:MAG: hypothetical protein WBM64_06525 [Woeseiaceae bacterium]
MFTLGRKTIRSWMVLYVALVTIALTNQNDDSDYSDAANLSPVMIGADAPALAVDELVRRSDI